MNADINIKAFEGTAYKVEKHNLYKGNVFGIPKGAILLASDVVMDGDESVAEVWLAVPLQAPEEDTPQRKVAIPPGAEAWPIEEEADYDTHEDEITVELLDGDDEEDSNDE